MLTGDNTAWTTTSSAVAQFESKSRTRFFATGGRRVQQGKSGVEVRAPVQSAWEPQTDVEGHSLSTSTQKTERGCERCHYTLNRGSR